jgi:hypothetical protein
MKDGYGLRARDGSITFAQVGTDHRPGGSGGGPGPAASGDRRSSRAVSRQERRSAGGSGKKISWTDLYGNTHDLDFVFERGGSPSAIGNPVAFIETAWRRYTKHSRNKAQEIQGAILPLATTHHRHAPFICVVLAGAFTAGALSQLRSLGFRVLHFTYDAIVAAFQPVGIDARFEEDTPDAVCAGKIKQWQALSQAKRERVAKQLLVSAQKQVDAFLRSLTDAILRQISRISVLPLHGVALERQTVENAIQSIENYKEHSTAGLPIAKYEIQVHYSNGDQGQGVFKSKTDAIDFLRSYQVPLRPAT